MDNLKFSGITENFTLPIKYSKNCVRLAPNVIEELEFNKYNNSADTNIPSNMSIYEEIYSPSSCFGKSVLQELSLYFTTDTSFLEDTQCLIKKMTNDNVADLNINKTWDLDSNTIQSTWSGLSGHPNFCSAYMYINTEPLKFINHNETWLKYLNIYSIVTPIISLITPFLLLIIPFFIIKLMGRSLTIAEYSSLLQKLFANNAVYSLFTNFNSVPTQHKIYLIFMSLAYFLSIYSSIKTCMKYYTSQTSIHSQLFTIKDYVSSTLTRLENFTQICKGLKSYDRFFEESECHKTTLTSLLDTINNISPFSISINKLGELGTVMHTFYKLFDCPSINKAMYYSFGFNGYVENMSNLACRIKSGVLNPAIFIDPESSEKTKFTKMYYPKFILPLDDLSNQSTTAIRGNCSLEKINIVSGPNASGKTTYLKSVIINTILTQQVGAGCYSSAKVKPYDHIYCYLNIPDTSGRDSLFEAEARRCKEILNSINNKDNIGKSHLCVFDELYSGTNPGEAVSASFGFVKYLSNQPNVDCIVTTHYSKLCKKLKDIPNVQNYHMKVIKNVNTDTLIQTFLLKKGISRTKGGIPILRQFDYPEEILQSAVQ